MMKNNRIPRKFNCIIARMLVDTSMDKSNDIIHVTKNDRGYLAFNTRTEKYATPFVSMLRNGKVIEIISID